MDQLQLEPTPDIKTYRTRLYRNYKSTEVCTNPKSRVSTEFTRRSLVEVLQRSPYSFDWEEYPRSTGWYGINNDLHQPIVYQLIIESNEESSNE